MARNYDGIKILDLSVEFAGAFAGMLLSDMGAEVTMVEQPGGNPLRRYPPVVSSEKGEQSLLFLSLCRGKKSIVLDLEQSAEDRNRFIELVKQTDAILECFVPGTMDSWGLDYRFLKEINPRLIFCSITLFGETPSNFYPSYDLLAQAAGGVVNLTGDSDRYPLPEGAELASISAATHAAAAIGGALFYRNRTGKGQSIDISMRDCMAALLETAIPTYEMFGIVLGRVGSHHPFYAPYGVFDSGNDHFGVIAGISNAQWVKIADTIGRHDLAIDPEYQLTSDRGKHFSFVKGLMEDYLQDYEGDDWEKPIDTLIAAGAPCAPVGDIPLLVHEEIFRDRKNLVTVDDPVIGEITLPVCPIRFTETETFNPVPAPLLGQHDAEIFARIENEETK